MTKQIIGVIVFVVLMAGFGLIVARAVDTTEANECQEWQEDADEYADYYLTEWQQAQCK